MSDGEQCVGKALLISQNKGKEEGVMLLLYTNHEERLLSHKVAWGCLKLVPSHIFSCLI